MGSRDGSGAREWLALPQNSTTKVIMRSLLKQLLCEKPLMDTLQMIEAKRNSVSIVLQDMWGVPKKEAGYKCLSWPD